MSCLGNVYAGQGHIPPTFPNVISVTEDLGMESEAKIVS
ncbi:hypothetical protein RHRU231_450190 [Rhodococcus ruber]|uniref:Uncharacterized protein n=1 Tax=Rhodococcus ruber TaxID=1830 RepID=A0A098BJZ9_9NOCA|nr:hypothetical protein RHRU231_450190 [Rhodococcus ruber]